MWKYVSGSVLLSPSITLPCIAVDGGRSPEVWGEENLFKIGIKFANPPLEGSLRYGLMVYDGHNENWNVLVCAF